MDYVVPTYRPDLRAGDRPHRGGRPPPRLQQHRPHPAPHEGAGRRPHRRSSSAGARCATPSSAPACPRPTPSPSSRPPTWPPPASPPRASSWRTRCGPRSRCCARRCCPACCKAAAFNAGHGLPDVGLFEIGHVFLPPPAGQTLPDEREHLAVVMTGTVFRAAPRSRPAGRRPRRRRPAGGRGRGAGAGRLVARAGRRRRLRPRAGGGRRRRRRPRGGGRRDRPCRPGPPRPGRAGGRPARSTCRGFSTPPGRSGARSRRPATRRRPSTWLSSSTSRCPPARPSARCAGPPATSLEDVHLFDVFRSDALGPNKKSLAFGLRFRAPDRTLTDEEVGGLRQRLIDAMAKEHGASLRG